MRRANQSDESEVHVTGHDRYSRASYWASFLIVSCHPRTSTLTPWPAGGLRVLDAVVDAFFTGEGKTKSVGRSARERGRCPGTSRLLEGVKLIRELERINQVQNESAARFPLDSCGSWSNGQRVMRSSSDPPPSSGPCWCDRRPSRAVGRSWRSGCVGVLMPGSDRMTHPGGGSSPMP